MFSLLINLLCIYGYCICMYAWCLQGPEEAIRLPGWGMKTTAMSCPIETKQWTQVHCKQQQVLLIAEALLQCPFFAGSLLSSHCPVKITLRCGFVWFFWHALFFLYSLFLTKEHLTNVIFKNNKKCHSLESASKVNWETPYDLVCFRATVELLLKVSQKATCQLKCFTNS